MSNAISSGTIQTGIIKGPGKKGDRKWDGLEKPSPLVAAWANELANRAQQDKENHSKPAVQGKETEGTTVPEGPLNELKGGGSKSSVDTRS